MTENVRDTRGILRIAFVQKEKNNERIILHQLMRQFKEISGPELPHLVFVD